MNVPAVHEKGDLPGLAVGLAGVAVTSLSYMLSIAF